MKRKIFPSSSSCPFLIFPFFFGGVLNADVSRRAQSLNGTRQGLESRGEERKVGGLEGGREGGVKEEKEKSEQSNSRDPERRRYLPVQLRPRPHIQRALKALGLSQATVALLIEWLPHSEAQTVQKHNTHTHTKSNVRSASSITCVNAQVQVKVRLPRGAAIQVHRRRHIDALLFGGPAGGGGRGGGG